MIKKTITIQFNEGLEVRPIALLVQEACQYSSQVHIEVENKKINAKSIMGMMSLGLTSGDKLTVVVDGADEEAAIAGVERFLLGVN